MQKVIFTCLILFLGMSQMTSAQVKTDTISTTSKNTEQFDVNAATQKYLDMLTPEQKAKSDSYFEGGYWIQLWGFIIEIAVAWIFLSLGLSKWIKRIALKAGRVNIQNLIYVLLYLLLAFLITFPFSVYTEFFREHQYGLSNMTFAGWFSEVLKSLALNLVFGSLLLMTLYIAMRKVKERWWLWGSGILIIFLVIGIFIGPVFISPIFNKYKPLGEGREKDEILSLLRANGVPVNNVYQFDASKQSTRISANVSGIGSTIRVSLNDNLLNKCTPAEIKSVLAHELGHYVLNHMYKLLIYLSIVVIIGFAFVNFIMNKAISRFGSKWGITSISDVGSLPLFVVIFAFYMFIATPFTNTIVRSSESEADIFGLNAAGEPDGFARVAMKLSEYRKINPGPLEEIIFFDHPSGRARVLMSMKWKAEHPDVICREMNR
jgi:STE24 endopeptidase